ncbi:hypothetical protein SAMN05216429_104197 [Marinobacter persicus]|uniref:Uncharacterized protein n=1 Tax=Marinobacter persicus TaxID=930118 RepID=A0A1I3T2Y0_9GAMM|nr:hypothetical protein [Marinobacter persicus]GHD40434.1 hypothetical protein GCM10008110_01340 [Marinobacter persicus]SFJ65285.1 hypothetical protein SAMN05216429_104197 [Marinobacter persicus]
MFQLVFKGECVEGTDLQTARNNAKTLFKASVEQLDRMFSGQPVVIRNKLEQVQAEKYRTVLAKHGMVAYVQPMPGTEAKPSAPERPEQPQAASKAPESSSRQATADKPAAPQPDPKAGPKTEPGDRLPVAGEKVDDILAGSALSLDPAGVRLVEVPEEQAPMFEHLDEWSLAPPGTDLGVERDLPPPVVPDVSHLSLADDDTHKD